MAATLQAKGPIVSTHQATTQSWESILRSSRLRLPSAFRECALSISKPVSSSTCCFVTRAMASESTVVEKLGVRVERSPPESRLSELGVRSWPKWGCPPSKFPWTYSDKETCYLLKGKVKVYGEGSSEYVEIGAGDLVVFPKGMSCAWEVSETVDKHYNFS
ncbi:hypothetical protein GOP47_0005030 [Adiantum capillus-veneris]|uniref:(S)-ureidoglycine aminohydrolase cupin domain-containing protein n=1 Tax=Adiantum capillus-veneris TaxID=13818 RepID=A0A9D4V582_ADICA|nr:hypothetical protein GOP47_0005030 [Adiantum capillus-veneris]